MQISPVIFPPPETQREIEFQLPLENFIRVVAGILNGGVRMDENMDIQIINRLFADTLEQAIPHRLNRVPIGYFVVGKNVLADLVDGATAWTNTTLFVRSNTANANFRFIVF